MSISPQEVLPVGSKVSVGDKIGIVVKVAVVAAVPSGMIAVHTIKFTHKKMKIRNIQTAELKYKIEPIKNTTQTINYSFINLL